MNINATLQQAIHFHQAGKFQEAERLYRSILQAYPIQPEANHNLGLLIMLMGKPASGLTHLEIAWKANPSNEQFCLTLTECLLSLNRSNDALRILENATQRKGFDSPQVHHLLQLAQGIVNEARPALPIEQKMLGLLNANHHAALEVRITPLTEQYPNWALGWQLLGIARISQNKDGEAALRRVIQLKPSDAEAHFNLGTALNIQGRHAEAEASYRRALVIKPDYADAHYNLGVLLNSQGRHSEAEASYRRALEAKLDYVNAHCNLGVLLNSQGRHSEAEASYRRALEIKPDSPEILNNLAMLLLAQGEQIKALDVIIQSLKIEEKNETKQLFIECVKHLRITHDDDPARVVMVRALTEPWGRPADLARIVADLVMLGRGVGESAARAAKAWPQRLPAQNLFEPAGLAMIAADPLLSALLGSTPICNIDLERFLTMARQALLDAATGASASDSESDAILRFYGALAQQCFINEYVFAQTDDETGQAKSLRDSLAAALESGAPVSGLWTVAVAAYFPLHSLPFAARLLGRQWPDAVSAVLAQQIREPAEEQQYRDDIPRLTSINDEVSLLVQSQYEDNPFPRWTKLPPGGKPLTIDALIGQRYPLAVYRPLNKDSDIDILVAGCGTGQHSIETAQKFRDARVLAIDLSLTSLCYAKRKTQELGLTSIEYAQADILKLGSFGRSFDIIESSGVLHHLADPMAGWRILLPLLRPGGVMHLGFYSALARQGIARARSFIGEQGYASSAKDIRRCRQDMVNLHASTHFETVLRLNDFFSISECRDLLFHTQERHMTLAGIDTFLNDNNLRLLGFDIDAHALQLYKSRFPEDQAATNLGSWQAFENDNPDTFIGMYQFWVQKTDY